MYFNPQKPDRIRLRITSNAWGSSHPLSQLPGRVIQCICSLNFVSLLGFTPPEGSTEVLVIRF
jgi:hypothetical protein